MHYLRDKPIIFFNASHHNMDRTRHGSLKGYKIRAKEESKVFDLKSKRVEQINMRKLRFSDYDIGETEKEDITNRYDKRATYQHFRQRSLSNRASFDKKTVTGGENSMMVTSRSAQMEQEQPIIHEPIYFNSPNLEGKLNEYLNMMIRKNEDTQEDLKAVDMESLVQLKDRKSNVFMRNMKKSLKRKNSSQHSKEEPDFMVGIRDPLKETLRLLKKFEGKKDTKSVWVATNK